MADEAPSITKFCRHLALNLGLMNNTTFWYHKIMNRKHQRTLEAIFKQPIQSNIVWKDIEALIRHLDAEITEGEGSRVRFALNGVRATFH